jgi:syndecan 1
MRISRNIAGTVIAGTAVAALFAIGSTVMAQQPQGVTSGPAAGSEVQPSTAVQKPAPSTGTQSPSEQAKGGAAAAGAPGVTAQPGTEGGPALTPGTTSGSTTGSVAQPSTAVQKAPATKPASEQAKEGAAAAGAPGVTAQPGTEGGPPPLRPGGSNAK